ncbi:MAG TPA: extracellular solute-binding protein [Candidatus Moranbacteria bacterium]|nr:extracellular solute-binding protein [Candidatus Moranbacteria bacterium]
MKTRIALFLLIILITLPLSGCLKKRFSLPYKMDLEIWGTFDDSSTFQAAISQYKKLNPQIRNITFRKLSSNFDDYEKQLLESLASGSAPDIIYIKNTGLTKHQNKIVPLPVSDQFLRIFRDSFVDVAYQDFVSQNQIYAMPLYCDTLALYYNKKIFNQAGITNPPRTWDELREQTKILTKIDDYGNINQSAIALGRAKDPGAINRAGDIFMLMAMQRGADLDKGLNEPTSFDSNPGNSALQFFTDFSRGSSDVYTWNSKMDYSIDSFRFGKTAMMINYSYLKDRLQSLDPGLQFDIAPVPQFNQTSQVNFPNYWGLAVVKDKKIPSLDIDPSANYTNEDRIREAWSFVNYLTLKPTHQSLLDPAREYLNITNKPAARKDLIEEQKNEEFRGIFARQAITAKSWRQPDESAIDKILNDMIEAVNYGYATVQDSLDTADTRINVLRGVE